MSYDKQTEPEEGAIIPIRGEIVVPQKPGEAWPEEVREELYQCYKQTGSASRARRWYLRQAGENQPAPTERTIRDWMKFHAWPERAEAEYQIEFGRLEYLTKRQALANYVVATQVQADVLTGAFDENPLVGMLRQKAVDSVFKHEQYQVRAQAPKPLEERKALADVPREEREAKLKASMIQRGKTG